MWDLLWGPVGQMGQGQPGVSRARLGQAPTLGDPLFCGVDTAKARPPPLVGCAVPPPPARTLHSLWSSSCGTGRGSGQGLTSSSQAVCVGMHVSQGECVLGSRARPPTFTERRTLRTPTVTHRGLGPTGTLPGRCQRAQGHGTQVPRAWDVCAHVCACLLCVCRGPLDTAHTLLTPRHSVTRVTPFLSAQMTRGPDGSPGPGPAGCQCNRLPPPPPARRPMHQASGLWGPCGETRPLGDTEATDPGLLLR